MLDGGLLALRCALQREDGRVRVVGAGRLAVGDGELRADGEAAGRHGRAHVQIPRLGPSGTNKSCPQNEFVRATNSDINLKSVSRLVINDNILGQLEVEGRLTKHVPGKSPSGVKSGVKTSPF